MSRRSTSNDRAKTVFLDLTAFKTVKCSLEAGPNHDPKRCPFYHDEAKDRRRQLGTYGSDLCPHMNWTKKKMCPKGDSCHLAHNTVEKFYHPEMYKAKFCESFTDPSKTCEYGDFCAFAHNESEISIDLIERFDRD